MWGRKDSMLLQAACRRPGVQMVPYQFGCDSTLYTESYGPGGSIPRGGTFVKRSS